MHGVTTKITNVYIYQSSDKRANEGKAIPVQALTGPESSRRLRLPYFMIIGT